MMETDPYAPMYRTAEPMEQFNESKSAEIPAGWKPVSASERRKKVDSVASLNEMAERDMAEFMSESSLANNLFGYSPLPARQENFLDEENFSGQGNMVWNRNFIDIRERSVPPPNQMYGNVPLYLPQSTPISAILHQSHSSYGPPSGPITHSPTFFPVTPILPHTSPSGMSAVPTAIPVHNIPQNHFVAIQNSGLRVVQSPPSAVMVQSFPPRANKSPLHDESPRLRERAQPQPQQPTREHAQDFSRERSQPPPVVPSPNSSAIDNGVGTTEHANLSKPAVKTEPPRSVPSAPPPSTSQKPPEKKQDDENGTMLAAERSAATRARQILALPPECPTCALCLRAPFLFSSLPPHADSLLAQTSPSPSAPRFRSRGGRWSGWCSPSSKGSTCRASASPPTPPRPSPPPPGWEGSNLSASR